MRHPPVAVMCQQVLSASAAARCAKLFEHAIDELGVGGGVSACLYSRFIAFHLNAPSWWNGCTSTHSTFFIGATNRAIFSTLAGSSVRPGTSVKRTHDRLAHRGQPLRETQRRRQIAAGHLAIGFGIPALDIEQHQIELDRNSSSARSPRKPEVSIAVCRPIFLARRQDASREGKLHHRLAAGNRQAAVERPQRRRKIAPDDRSRARRETYVPSFKCQVSGLWQ